MRPLSPVTDASAAISNRRPVAIELWENQRWYAQRGWSSERLHHDPPVLSTRDRTHAVDHTSARLIAAVRHAGLEKAYEWAGPWIVDVQFPGSTDAEGWRYAEAWDGFAQPVNYPPEPTLATATAEDLAKYRDLVSSRRCYPEAAAGRSVRTRRWVRTLLPTAQTAASALHTEHNEYFDGRITAAVEVLDDEAHQREAMQQAASDYYCEAERQRSLSPEEKQREEREVAQRSFAQLLKNNGNVAEGGEEGEGFTTPFGAEARASFALAKSQEEEADDKAFDAVFAGFVRQSSQKGET